MKIARPVVKQVNTKTPAYFASDCPMAAVHIANLADSVDLGAHPMTLLRMGYGL